MELDSEILEELNKELYTHNWIVTEKYFRTKAKLREKMDRYGIDPELHYMVKEEVFMVLVQHNLPDTKIREIISSWE